MVIGESLGEVFLKEIVSHERAYVTYGTWEKRSDVDLLMEFLKCVNKKPLSVMGHCQIDPKAMLKIYAYFNALGATIEKLSGFITSVVINMDDEGNALGFSNVGDLNMLCPVLLCLCRACLEYLFH